MTERSYIYTKDQLELLAYRLLKAGGLREDDAKVIAQDLVLADMRGMSSHGISRIPMYLKRIDCKCVNAQPEIKVEKKSAAVLEVNGDDGMGFLVAHKAMEEGIKLAKETGIAMVGCTPIPVRQFRLGEEGLLFLEQHRLQLRFREEITVRDLCLICQ